MYEQLGEINQGFDQVRRALAALRKARLFNEAELQRCRDLAAENQARQAASGKRPQATISWLQTFVGLNQNMQLESISDGLGRLEPQITRITTVYQPPRKPPEVIEDGFDSPDLDDDPRVPKDEDGNPRPSPDDNLEFPPLPPLRD